LRKRKRDRARRAVVGLEISLDLEDPSKGDLPRLEYMVKGIRRKVRMAGRACLPIT